MKACKVDERQLAEWIDGSTGAIRYLGPAITERLARKILAAEKRTGERNHVVIELDDEVDRSGYGQAAGVRMLHDDGATVQHRAGLRIAALAAPGIGVVWSPIAERVDPIQRVSINGIWMEGVELGELRRWMARMMGEQLPEGSGPRDGRQGTSQPVPKETHAPIVSARASTDQDEAGAIVDQGVDDGSSYEAVDQRHVPAEPEVHLRPWTRRGSRTSKPTCESIPREISRRRSKQKCTRTMSDSSKSM